MLRKQLNFVSKNREVKRTKIFVEVTFSSAIFSGVGVLGVLLMSEYLIRGVSSSPSLDIFTVSFKGVFVTDSAFDGVHSGVFELPAVVRAGVEVYILTSFIEGLLKNCEGENGSCFNGVCLDGDVKLQWNDVIVN